MPNSPEEREIARSNSWENKAMPDSVVALPFDKTYSIAEFGVLSRGCIPKEMEDKWFVFMDDNTLFFHRSWTGLCIYKVIFEKNADRYVAVAAFVNQDPDEYNCSNSNYETTLLTWLIESFLLHNQIPFPVLKSTQETYPGLYQHHISGTGYPEIKIPENAENE
jgi:hypothetical protein